MRTTGQATATPTFQVGVHIVLLSCTEGRWTSTVDTVTSDKWYMSQAEAWAAGVREAYRLDGLSGEKEQWRSP